MMERYSVLMSVYHKEQPEFLKQALDSMLHQTVQPDEIVLVCDGPLTPALDELIGQYRDRYATMFNIIRFPENQGLGLALQEGLSQCRNELVARMDTDDIAMPYRMEKQLNFLRDHPDICAVGGQIQEFQDSPEHIIDCRIVPTDPGDIRKWARRRNPMNHMTILFRKSKVLEAGSYQHLSGFEDYYLWARMLAKGQHLGNIQEICCLVRVDADFYHRRGGGRYFQNTVQMERLLLELGLITKMQFYQNTTMRFLGTVVIPAGVRSYLTKKLLRKPSYPAEA